MPALTFQGRSIHFSVYFDTITIYHKEILGPSQNSDDENVVSTRVRSSRHALKAGNPVLISRVDFSLNFLQFESELRRTAVGSLFETQLDHNDNNHQLYHRDHYRIDDDHSHCKFKSMLTRNNINEFLDVLVRNNLMAPSERAAFLNLYDQRFTTARTQLETKLTRDKVRDAAIIIREIRNCTDIDILVDLQKYLSTNQFDYLRVRTTNPSEPSLCQGTDEKANAVETTSAWAHIEESFTLQIAENIRRDCTHFTPSLVKARETQFKRDHRFFGMNHFSHPTDVLAPQVSLNYLPFTQADSKGFTTASDQYFDVCLNKGVPPTPTAKRASSSFWENKSDLISLRVGGNVLGTTAFVKAVGEYFDPELLKLQGNEHFVEIIREQLHSAPAFTLFPVPLVPVTPVSVTLPSSPRSPKTPHLSPAQRRLAESKLMGAVCKKLGSPVTQTPKPNKTNSPRNSYFYVEEAVNHELEMHQLDLLCRSLRY